MKFKAALLGLLLGSCSPVPGVIEISLQLDAGVLNCICKEENSSSSKDFPECKDPEIPASHDESKKEPEDSSFSPPVTTPEDLPGCGKVTCPDPPPPQ